MSSARVRPARGDDFEAVAQLLAEHGRPQLTGETVARARTIYERYVARADTAPLVAEQGGQVVGFMSLEFRDRLNQVQPQAWIPDLIVTTAARGQGAGRALLRGGFELARGRNCWSVTLESGYARQVAHALYRSDGMVDEGLYFLLLL